VLDFSDNRRVVSDMRSPPGQPRGSWVCRGCTAGKPPGRSRLNSAFADLDYAIYLARPERRSSAGASAAKPPLTAEPRRQRPVRWTRRSLLVMTPRRELGGDLMLRLPCSSAVSGTAIALAAALMTERLVRRRAHAEELAAKPRLFSEQRSGRADAAAQPLPEERPESRVDLGFDMCGVDGVDIGGDWYDVIGVGDGKVIIVVGDVSVVARAATAMASLRYRSVRTWSRRSAGNRALQLTNLINVAGTATCDRVCGRVDVAGHSVSFANAGHPNPLRSTSDC